MKLAVSFVIACLLVAISSASPADTHVRQRRDLVCAIRGHSSCNVYCKGKGFKDGECVWDTETGAMDCICHKEKRGIRCNLGGPNTCHYSCVFIGHREGHCGEGDKCVCGGGNNRWGNMLQTVADRI